MGVDLFASTIWHERTESTSFAGRFVQLDPPPFCPLGRIREHIILIIFVTLSLQIPYYINNLTDE